MTLPQKPVLTKNPTGVTPCGAPYGTVQCAFYYEVSKTDGWFLSVELARKANSLLTQHHMDLRLESPPRTLSHPGVTFEYGFPIVSGNEYETADLFQAARKVYDPPLSILPVIFCHIDDNGTNGSTKPIKVDGQTRWVVLIFANHPYHDRVTLLHEIGHAAGRDHVSWKWKGSSDDPVFIPPHDIMCTPNDLQPEHVSKVSRTLVTHEEVAALASAPFTVRTSYLPSLNLP